jgi:hypothetical protein
MTGDDDVEKDEDGLADARFIRDKLDGLIARAREQPDPVAWLRQQVQAALDRVDGVDRPSSVKEEAKRQLFNLERRLVRAIREGPSGAIVAALGYTLLTGSTFF